MAFELRRDDVLDCFAARICRAAPELVSGVFTLLRGAKDHLTTASRAPPPDSGLAAARLKIGDVLAAGSTFLILVILHIMGRMEIQRGDGGGDAHQDKQGLKHADTPRPT